MKDTEREQAMEQLDYQDVLISVANPETAKQLVTLAHFITPPGATFHIMNVTKSRSLPERGRSWRKGADLVMEITHHARRLGRVTKPIAATADSIPNSIVEAADELEAGLLVMGWFGRITPVAVRRSSVVNKVLHRAPCDVAVLKSRTDLNQINKVVMPVVPDNPRYKRLALLDKFLSMSEAEGELIHVVTPDSGMSPEEIAERLQELASLMRNSVQTRLVQANSILDGLLDGSKEADLVLVGPGREWIFDRFLFGRTADNLTNRLDSSVVMFKSQEHKMVAWSRGLMKALASRLKRLVP